MMSGHFCKFQFRAPILGRDASSMKNGWKSRKRKKRKTRRLNRSKKIRLKMTKKRKRFRR